jgi:hypothetical protein
MGVAALSAQLSKIIAAHYPRTQQTHAGEGCGKTRDKADTSPAMNILKLCASAGIKSPKIRSQLIVSSFVQR